MDKTLSLARTEEEPAGQTLRDLYHVLFRQKNKVLFFMAAVMLTVSLGLLLAPRIYNSESKLLVRLGRESVALDPTVTGGVVSVNQRRESELNSEVEILNSTALAEKVVRALGPQVFLASSRQARLAALRGEQAAQDGADWSLLGGLASLLRDLGILPTVSEVELAAEALARQISIKVLPNTNVLTISYESDDAGLAQQVLSRLLDLYLDQHIMAHRSSGSLDFFTRQTRQVQDRLNQQEQALSQLKNSAGIANLAEQRNALVGRAGELQREMDRAKVALSAARAKTAGIQAKLKELPEYQVTMRTSGMANSAQEGMRQHLYELEMQEADLAARYHDNSVKVRDVRAKIAQARQILGLEAPQREEVTQGVNATYQALHTDLYVEQANLAALAAKAQGLERQMDAVQEEIRALNQTEPSLLDLQREIAALDASYRGYADKLEQTRIDQALEATRLSNISVIQAPTLSDRPVRPKKVLTLLLGLLLSLLGGVGVAFLAERLDHSIRSSDDIERRLSVPNLGSIPQVEETAQARLAARRS